MLPEYIAFTRETAHYPHDLHGAFAYLTLGLAGEAGEVANEVKKVFSKEGGVLTDLRRQQILDECGDVLWYLTRLVDELGSNLDLVARNNQSKLEGRALLEKR
jgi:NTP pyrophosphatase (non-canonical NTP hydrolase)